MMIGALRRSRLPPPATPRSAARGLGGAMPAASRLSLGPATRLAALCGRAPPPALRRPMPPLYCICGPLPRPQCVGGGPGKRAVIYRCSQARFDMRYLGQAPFYRIRGQMRSFTHVLCCSLPVCCVRGPGPSLWRGASSALVRLRALFPRLGPSGLCRDRARLSALRGRCSR